MTQVDDNGGHSQPLKLGKLPAQPARPKLRFASIAAQLAAPPAVEDWTTGVEDWPMYGNDRYGDCVEAEMGHHVEQITRFGKGTTAEVSDADVLGAYSAITGFDPDKPGTDQGTLIEDALSWWRKNPLSTHQIVAYASVDVSNATEVKQAVQLFGGLSIGFNFPASAMDQFNAGLPWDVVKRSPLRGGHCVLLAGYDAQYFTCVTWGALQKMTPAFWRAYVDEAWVVIDDEMASNLSRYGVSLHALGEEFASLTGQANPFPGIDPAPAPEPPVPSDHSAEDVATAVRQALTDLGL
jgi:hypothetical protein